jgi:hypothetical protein
MLAQQTVDMGSTCTAPVPSYLCRFGDCDGIASNGCEANLNTDAANCGACKTAATPFANAAAACDNGQPALGTCNTGWVCYAYYRCRLNLLAAPPWYLDAFAADDGHATNLRIAVGPLYPCRFADCDGILWNGCEGNLNTDVANCGACTTYPALFPNAQPACLNGHGVLGDCYFG